MKRRSIQILGSATLRLQVPKYHGVWSPKPLITVLQTKPERELERLSLMFHASLVLFAVALAKKPKITGHDANHNGDKVAKT